MQETELKIRRATVDDAEIVAEYNVRLALETEGTALDRAVLLPGVQAALADANKALYFLAEMEGDVVGQCMVTYEWSDWRNGPLWWFQSVYVRADWRRRGIFRALFEHVLAEGKAAGAVGVRLYAHSENTNALATYQSLGMNSTHYIVLERIPL
jgi:GNAT superfamily N-acetyltransferase